jgi:hypothetical protein
VASQPRPDVMRVVSNLSFRRSALNRTLSMILRISSSHVLPQQPTHLQTSSHAA